MSQLISQLTESRFRLIRAANVWSGDEGWDILFYYNIYRFGLAVLLMAFTLPGFNITTVGLQYEALLAAAGGFVLVSAFAFGTIKRRAPALHIQAHTLFLVDLAFISALSFSRELHVSTIFIFYITTVGATAVMFRTRTALGYAAIATIAIYARDVFNVLQGLDQVTVFYSSALTALGLFSIVLVVSHMAQRTRVVQDVMEQQELELADLDDINQNVVDQLDIGILFIDNKLRVKLINDSARELIGAYIHHGRVASELGNLLNNYVEKSTGRDFVFRHKDRIFGLHTTQMRSGILVRIEDQTDINRRIRSSKLSSMGRLAGAIAHEIRNPLNAINHAAQLISTDEKNPESTELVEIIRKHVQRIDGIIESVLEKSRPGRAQQEELYLKDWLQGFVETFRQGSASEADEFVITGEPIRIYFDPTQLEQVLTNLCENSLKYGKSVEGKSIIMLETGTDDRAVPFLTVVDRGIPISDHQAEQLFEPFFTTDSRSTGLGLYLVREFCSLNGAEIDYFRDADKQGFKISFLMDAEG